MTEQNRKDLSDRPINLLIIVPDCHTHTHTHTHTHSLSLSLSLSQLIGPGTGSMTQVGLVSLILCHMIQFWLLKKRASLYSFEPLIQI